ncbi:hypothetical protein [uncultured Helicobacter sp.]|nr:hypothetical protein [uncultured Helicobacter sp.]
MLAGLSLDVSQWRSNIAHLFRVAIYNSQLLYDYGGDDENP